MFFIQNQNKAYGVLYRLSVNNNLECTMMMMMIITKNIFLIIVTEKTKRKENKKMTKLSLN